MTAGQDSAEPKEGPTFSSTEIPHNGNDSNAELLSGDTCITEFPFCLDGLASCNTTSAGHCLPTESMYLTTNIHGLQVDCLIDTGSTISILHPLQYQKIPENLRPLLEEKRLPIKMADGGIVESIGEAEV